MVAYENRENATAFARAKNSVIAITETFNRNQALDMPVTDVATLAENHIKIALLRDVLSDVPNRNKRDVNYWFQSHQWLIFISATAF